MRWSVSRRRGRKVRESGEVMIESMLVLIPVLFALLFTLCLGFFFYQYWNVSLTARETASKVAELYPVLGGSLQRGAEDYAEVKETARYRSVPAVRGDEYETENAARGEEYGLSWLSLVSLAEAAGKTSVTVETEEDAPLMRHVTVRVEVTYTLPFHQGFEVFGLKGTVTFSGEGRAVCTDLADCLGTVNYLANLEEILGLKNVPVYTAANALLRMIQKTEAAAEN